MFQLAVKFIFELVIGSASTVTLGTAALNHEVRDDAVKLEAVVETVRRQLLKIRGGLGYFVVVQLTTNVGQSELTLGELINLMPGDVIEIDNPQKATVLAQCVPLIAGRLGVHQGRNAVETIEWLDPQQRL